MPIQLKVVDNVEDMKLVVKQKETKKIKLQIWDTAGQEEY